MRDIAIGAVVAASAVGLLFAIIFYATFRRRARLLGLEAWAKQWKRVEPERRKRVAAAVKRGQAVDDPRDADLALGLIDHAEKVRSLFPRRGGVRVVEAALAAVLVLGALAIAADAGEAAVLLAPFAVALVLALLLRPVTRRQRERMAAAKRANEELVRGV